MKISETLPAFRDIVVYEKWKSQWVNKNELGLGDYIFENIHPENLLISSKLFFPDFIEVDECVLLRERYSEENFLNWKKKLKDPILIEKTLNHFHVYDAFGGNFGEISDLIYEQIGSVLKISWEFSLGKCFPNKKFMIESYNSDLEYGPIVTFHQKLN